MLRISTAYFATAPVGAAALPLRAGQRRTDRRHQATVRVGDDEAYAGQAAGGQRPEEGEPARTVLVAGHVQAEDLPAAVGVDPDRDQAVHVDRPAVLADLDDQRVDPHERVRAGIQRPATERLDLRVQVPGHLRDLTLGQLFDAELLDQLLHPPRRHPEQIRGRDHADQCLLGPAAMLEQPVREVRARAQLRDRQLDRPGTGVPLPAAVAVTRVRPLHTALAVLGAAQRVGLRGHQRVGEGFHHRPQHIRARRFQMLAQQVSDVQTLCCGHRRSLLRDLQSIRRICGGRLLRPEKSRSYTTSVDVTTPATPADPTTHTRRHPPTRQPTPAELATPADPSSPHPPNWPRPLTPAAHTHRHPPTRQPRPTEHRPHPLSSDSASG